MMLGARAIWLRAWGLSPHTGDLAVDSPCPPLLSKRERCRLSQVCALHALLLSIYKRVMGQASGEHLSGGNPLWYTTSALHA